MFEAKDTAAGLLPLPNEEGGINISVLADLMNSGGELHLWYSGSQSLTKYVCTSDSFKGQVL